MTAGPVPGTTQPQLETHHPTDICWTAGQIRALPGNREQTGPMAGQKYRISWHKRKEEN